MLDGLDVRPGQITGDADDAARTDPVRPAAGRIVRVSAPAFEERAFALPTPAVGHATANYLIAGTDTNTPDTVRDTHAADATDTLTPEVLPGFGLVAWDAGFTLAHGVLGFRHRRE